MTEQPSTRPQRVELRKPSPATVSDSTSIVAQSDSCGMKALAHSLAKPTAETTDSESEPALSVLVVDDDVAMCRSMRRVLLLDGYRVETAGSVGSMLARHDLGDFFAILLDRRLPDGDASDTIAQIRETAENAAILIVTGHADMDSTLAAIRQGVDDYLIKPVEPETLRSRLSSLAELYRVRRSLRESEARMRFLVEHLPAGAVYVDHEKLFMNRAVEEMTGYSAEEIGTVSDWFSVLCRDRAETCQEKYSRVKAEGFQQRCLFPIVRCDGMERGLEIAGYRYNNHEVWLVTDVTELHDAQQQLVQAERLAAIGEMVTGLAHESRNALQRARGCLDLLELDLGGKNEQLDLVQRIRRSLGDLQRNYEEVRSYAAPIVLQSSRTDVGQLIHQTFDDLHFEFGRRDHLLELNVAPDAEWNHVDPHRLVQVFRNVLENSIAASEAGSTITVSIEHRQGDEQSLQRIEIRDQGSGMSAETQARLFEPFYTTKQSGTGLGMAICRRIIEAHEGTIEAIGGQDPSPKTIKSAERNAAPDRPATLGPGTTGPGTTIRIELPLKRAK